MAMSVTVHLNVLFVGTFVLLGMRWALFPPFSSFFVITALLTIFLAHLFRATPSHFNSNSAVTRYFSFRKCTECVWECAARCVVRSNVINFSFASAWLNEIHTLLCIKSPSFRVWIWTNVCSPVLRHYSMNLNHLGLQQQWEQQH